MFSYVNTIVNARMLLLEVDDGWIFRDPDLLGEALIVRLDELDAHCVAIVVNLLKVLDRVRALFAIWRI